MSIYQPRHYPPKYSPFWIQCWVENKLGCLFFLEEGFKAEYVYASVGVAALYSYGAVCKNVCDFVGSYFGSIQILYDTLNFHKDLVSKGVIIKDPFLIFL